VEWSQPRQLSAATLEPGGEPQRSFRPPLAVVLLTSTGAWLLKCRAAEASPGPVSAASPRMRWSREAATHLMWQAVLPPRRLPLSARW
jgi:hypothetical protein